MGVDVPPVTPTAHIVNAGSNVAEYVYRRRTDAAARGLQYGLEVTEDLSTAWNTNGYSEVGTSPLEAGFEAVTNQVDTTPDTGFVRLKVAIDD